MKAPERIETSRLLLRQPTHTDAESILLRYAGNPAVTKYLSWPTHQTVDDTRMFLAFSEAEWNKWPAGPYLIESRTDHRLLGGTGLAFQEPSIAATGYVLAQDSWGRGYATEALAAIVTLSPDLGIARLFALCHPDNTASARVLGKCGFHLEERLSALIEFPNLRPGHREDCLRYVWG
jgi:[ribosomal protein S5]-alanine N-acetyltransferase